MNASRFNPWFCLFTLVGAAGCSSWNLQSPKVWPFASDKPGSPTQVAAMWTDTVMYQPNQAPMRGFGGRLMFYEKDKKDPIKVEGSLTVYAFDENTGETNKVRPDRKYVFTKEELATHYSKSKIGHSYSVWLPWDVAGGQQKEISLIVRFKPEKGSVVISDQSKHLLPGETPVKGLAKQDSAAPLTNGSPGPAGAVSTPPWTASAAATPPIQTIPQSTTQWASYQTPLDAAATTPAFPGNNETPKQMRSTTINMPRGLHLQTLPTTPLAPYTPPPPRQPLVGAVSATPSPGAEANRLPANGFNSPTVKGNPPSTHFSPGQLPVRGASNVPPGRDHGPWAPIPSILPYPPASTPPQNSADSVPPRFAPVPSG
jgi:hypothetical protein